MHHIDAEAGDSPFRKKNEAIPVSVERVLGRLNFE
jgi:hypothetical protein